jgi:putative ABC transport system permease protein
MFKNYLKTAWRNFLKYKFFSVINITGLALGLACCILAGLFIIDELSYDRQNKDATRIYRVVKDFINDDGGKTPDATTPPAIATAIQKEIPEVEHVTRLFPRGWGNNFYVRSGEKKFMEENLYHADSSVFEVFTIPFVKGDPKTALDDPNAIVLTESAATKYFGREDPIGKTLDVDDWPPKVVTAVIKDIPRNAHFKIDMIASLKSLDAGGRLNQAWGWYSFYTYMKLKPGSGIASVDKKIRAIVKKNQPADRNYFYSQALTSIHLSSHLGSELMPNSDKSYLYIFGTIVLFIILIACINYVNLTTSRSSLRAKEIGVRKISGAARSALAWQFLGESVMFSLVASIVSVAIAQFLLPAVNTITGKHLALNPGGNYFIVVIVFVFALLTGVLAGIYPALYLSSFNPVNALQGGRFPGLKNFNFRKILVVAQFTISITLITGAAVVIQQVSFIQHAKLGLDKDHVITINDVLYLDADKRAALKNELLQIPGVTKVAASDAVLGSQNWTRMVKSRGSQNNHLINFLTVDEDFTDALGIKIKEGRNFYPSDQEDAIILNEKSIKELGVPPPFIGQQILWRENKETGQPVYAKVIGIAADFHFASMRNEIQPFAFVSKKTREWFFNVKIAGANMSGTLESIRKVWDKNVKSRPFQYTFLDETYAKLYESEMHFKTIFFYMTIISIFISCLGLFGFSLFATEQRAKEIGIRKVLGASIVEILRLISLDFIKLVLIASVISFPLSWWTMHVWLRDFAYRIDISWWVFLLSGILSLIIAIATISFQAIKAAIANPVKSLGTA